MVIGVRDGALAGHFVGAQPEAAVRDFLAQLLPSDGGRASPTKARALLAAGKTAEAEAAFRRALELDPRTERALVGLAGDAVAARARTTRRWRCSSASDPARIARRPIAWRRRSRIRQSGAGDEAGAARPRRSQPRTTSRRASRSPRRSPLPATLRRGARALPRHRQAGSRLSRRRRAQGDARHLRPARPGQRARRPLPLGAGEGAVQVDGERRDR